jgi:uncharacterized protein YbjQ (UPF0145 family)
LPHKTIFLEEIMKSHHSVYVLREKLEDARLQAVENLAARTENLSADSLRELSTLHLALTAVRQEINEHGAKAGWGSEDALK